MKNKANCAWDNKYILKMLITLILIKVYWACFAYLVYILFEKYKRFEVWLWFIIHKAIVFIFES